jgi:acetoin:2,6-dichlorophenolindophenol oxidoreductase subunit beta
VREAHPFTPAVILNICVSDITIVARSSMVRVAWQASKMLAEEGISAEVIDPRTIVPLDEETILASVRDGEGVQIRRERTGAE